MFPLLVHLHLPRVYPCPDLRVQNEMLEQSRRFQGRQAEIQAEQGRADRALARAMQEHADNLPQLFAATGAGGNVIEPPVLMLPQFRDAARAEEEAAAAAAAGGGAASAAAAAGGGEEGGDAAASDAALVQGGAATTTKAVGGSDAPADARGDAEAAAWASEAGVSAAPALGFGSTAAPAAPAPPTAGPTATPLVAVSEAGLTTTLLSVPTLSVPAVPTVTSLMTGQGQTASVAGSAPAGPGTPSGMYMTHEALPDASG